MSCMWGFRSGSRGSCRPGGRSGPSCELHLPPARTGDSWWKNCLRKSCSDSSFWEGEDTFPSCYRSGNALPARDLTQHLGGIPGVALQDCELVSGVTWASPPFPSQQHAAGITCLLTQFPITRDTVTEWKYGFQGSYWCYNVWLKYINFSAYKNSLWTFGSVSFFFLMLLIMENSFSILLLGKDS